MKFILFPLLFLASVAALIDTSPRSFYGNNSCYAGDNEGKMANITVLLGSKFVAKYHSRLEKRLQTLFSIARVIFKAQLNVQLHVHEMHLPHLRLSDECDVL